MTRSKYVISYTLDIFGKSDGEKNACLTEHDRITKNVNTRVSIGHVPCAVNVMLID